MSKRRPTTVRSQTYSRTTKNYRVFVVRSYFFVDSLDTVFRPCCSLDEGLLVDDTREPFFARQASSEAASLALQGSSSKGSQTPIVPSTVKHAHKKHIAARADENDSFEQVLSLFPPSSLSKKIRLRHSTGHPPGRCRTFPASL